MFLAGPLTTSLVTDVISELSPPLWVRDILVEHDAVEDT